MFDCKFVINSTHNKRRPVKTEAVIYEGWNFNSGNYLFTTDTKTGVR